MTDRPILMSAPMVRALLREIEVAGTGKTQTRRPGWRRTVPISVLPRDRHFKPTIWQKVRPGDRIWVKETARWSAEHQNFYFVADNKGCGNRAFREWPHKTRVSIHMPRWASRLTLVVTAARMERVQEISEDDAEAEGANIWPLEACEHPDFNDSYRVDFQRIWKSLHPNPPHRWEDNPEVVAVTFTVHQQNIDAMEAA